MNLRIIMRSYVLVGILAFCISTIYASAPGGISDEDRIAGPEIRGYVETLSKEIKTRATSALASSGGNGSIDPTIFENASLTALTYKSQVVAGANYYVKVRLGDYFFHVEIFRDLDGNLRLSDVVGPKNLEDPIGYN